MQLLLWRIFLARSPTTSQLALIPLPSLKPLTTTPQLKLHQLQAYNSSQTTVFKDQFDLPPAYSYPTDCNSLLPRPNQLNQHAETANSGHSRQHRRNDTFASKPTAIIRLRIISRIGSLWLKTRLQLMGNYLLGRPTQRTDYSEHSFV